MAEGRLTREDAIELMQHLLLKFEESGMWYSPMISGIYGGVQQLQGITLGGRDAEGNDVTNEMTHIVLEASRRLHILQPTIALRVHKDTPKELLAAATDVMRTGCGYPSLLNGEVLIPLLQSGASGLPSPQGNGGGKRPGVLPHDRGLPQLPRSLQRSPTY